MGQGYVAEGHVVAGHDNSGGIVMSKRLKAFRYGHVNTKHPRSSCGNPVIRLMTDWAVIENTEA